LVDVVELSSIVQELPHLDLTGGAERSHLAYKWSDAAVEHGSGISTWSRSNSIYLAGGSRAPDMPNPAGQSGALLGITANTGIHSSWIWTARIRLARAEQNQPIYLLPWESVQREVVVHEITHQWHVNSQAPANSLGHCATGRYQKDGRYCLMHTPYYNHVHNHELGDDEVALHYEVLPNTNVIDSEYLTIRRAAEPLRQPEQ
jgi:hypothetical protein